MQRDPEWNQSPEQSASLAMPMPDTNRIGTIAVVALIDNTMQATICIQTHTFNILYILAILKYDQFRYLNLKIL